MNDLRIIILAAGKGIRMKSCFPKVLHHLCGKPIIQYAIDVAKYLRPLKINIVLGYQNKFLKDFLGKDLELVLQKQLLGTADAIKCTKPYFKGYNGDVLVLCGDTPLLCKETVKELVAKHKKSNNAVTFLIGKVSSPQGYGRIIRDAGGSVIAIREEKDAKKEEEFIREVNVGVYCFRSEDLFGTIKDIRINERKREFYLTDIIALMVKRRQKIGVLQIGDPTEALGVNTREDLAFAESILRKKVLKKVMEKGVTIIDPNTTYIDEGVKIGRDTVIRPFTVIEHNVSIGQSCCLGPFCRIRAETKIGDNVEIGNFTEVSRSRMGEGCFMKHFSFLGDAIVGNRVNIGAGVVTANFDGKRKNITKILDDAFIGSDSILIAPLKVGRGAVTGAGCVVPKKLEIPDKSLVMGVPAKLISRRKYK